MEAIVAVYANWGIGFDGAQPLIIPADRKRFREITDGCAVIAGRKTLADFPGGRPLPGRKNIILTSSMDAIDGAVTVRSVKEALRAAQGEARAFVVGGGSVYASLLPYISRVYVTMIDAIPESDTYFKNLDCDPGFLITERSEDYVYEGTVYRFLTYERKGGVLAN